MKEIIHKNAVNIIIFLTFAILTFIMGINHEPWNDEAQAWLIARDCNIHDILFIAPKYEGTPALWYIVLKIFINIFNCSYEKLFVIPWLFSCLGIYLFLFKSKLPVIIKILFPFTFFIFYQYTVVARNYSLFFPMLAIIAVSYKNRLKKPYLYSFLLVLLSNISAYSFVIASVLFCFYVTDTIRFKPVQQCFGEFSSGEGKKIKNIISLIFILICLLLTALICERAVDCASYSFFKISNDKMLNFFNIIVNDDYFLYALGKSMLVIIAALYYYSARVFCKTKYQVLFFCLINFSVIFILCTLVCKMWHIGHLILTLIFLFWILADENNIKAYPFKQNKIFYIIIIFIFGLEIQNSINSFIYDIKNDYSGSKKAAQFIKENNLDKEEIIGFGFYAAALQPYFKHNIYSNFNKTYYEWKGDSVDEYFEKSKKTAPVLVVSDINDNIEYIYDFQNINNLKNNYESYRFKGQIRCGNWSENSDFIIFAKKKDYLNKNTQ